tara:strand:- start:5428 stop:5943 length:516 start_codon:yes stop_codon:yes gene_type:complete
MFVLLVSFSPGSTAVIPDKIKDKIDRAVTETYAVADFELQHITVPATVAASTPVTSSGENFFSLKAKEKTIGYLYLGEAPSKKNIFDYIVLFEPDWSVKKAKILIYREDYGRQVGSQRWLKQFIGLTPKDDITYGEQVDAIAGATISAKSMTTAVAKVLKTVGLLKEKGVL